MLIKQVPEGQRKLIATVVTMLVGVLAEKYMGGLSDNLTVLIGGALALFVGGNAMEYVAQIKAGKSGVPNLPPPQQEVDAVVQEDSQVVAIQEQLNKLDNICGQVFGKYDAQFKELQASLDKQAANTKTLIDIVNGRKPNEPQRFQVPSQNFPAE